MSRRFSKVSLKEPTVPLELRAFPICLRTEGRCISKCGLGHRRRRRSSELGRVSYKEESTRFNDESTRLRCTASNVPAVEAGFNNSDIS